MEKNSKKRNKVIYILLSVVIAIAVWAYADYENSMEVSLNVRGVPVEFTGEDTSLAEKGLMLTSGFDTTIDLKLSGPRSVMYKLNKNEVRIVADTSEIDTTGIQTLSYTVVYPDSVSKNSIRVKSTSAYSVTVTVGELYTKEIPVRVKYIGNLADEYFVEETELDPAVLVLRGQRDDLLNVEYASVTVDLGGTDTSLVQTMNYILYDYNGIVVENNAIRTSTKLVQADVTVYTTKSIPLTINYIEAPGSTLKQITSSIVPAEVEVKGTKDDLATVDQIVLDTIYLQDLSDVQTLTYNISVPSNLALVDENQADTTTVTIVVNGVSEKTVSTNNIAFSNVPDGYEATLASKKLDIKLRGLSEELDALTSDDVVIHADLSNISGEGSFTVDATISINGYSNISAKGKYQVVVQVSEKVEEQTLEETTAGTQGEATT